LELNKNKKEERHMKTNMRAIEPDERCSWHTTYTLSIGSLAKILNQV
jgi:hypothetical protein